MNFVFGFIYGVLLIMWIILLILYFKLVKRVDNLIDDSCDNMEDIIELEKSCKENLKRLEDLDEKTKEFLRPKHYNKLNEDQQEGKQ